MWKNIFKELLRTKKTRMRERGKDLTPKLQQVLLRLLHLNAVYTIKKTNESAMNFVCILICIFTVNCKLIGHVSKLRE